LCEHKENNYNTSTFFHFSSVKYIYTQCYFGEPWAFKTKEEITDFKSITNQKRKPKPISKL